MIRRLTALLFLAILFAGCGEKKFTIKGKLDGAGPDTYVYLDRLGGMNLEPYDSVMTGENGSFEFKGEIEYPEFFLIRLNEANFLTTLIEPGQKINLTADADSLGFTAEVKGSPGTGKMIEYDIRLQKAMKDLQELGKIYEENLNSPDLDSILAELDSMAQQILNEMNEYTRNFIDENLESMVSLIALYKQITPQVYILNIDKDLAYYQRVDSTLYALYPESEPVRTLHSQMETLMANMDADAARAAKTGMGALAPEIALPSPDGDTIRLSSTRGNYVLLDFWAAWCAPCRSENPNLVKAYNKYNAKGFEIFQVSLDQTREAWLEGIGEDKIGDWIHVSDLKYWSSEVVPLYGIQSIPANYLLDTEGRIIANNLRGEALAQKLAEIFE
ncbi:MAG: TlpA disulfide reductase family protein [Bacteroidales bacterium]|nr:TlpA disulfide reductase family protein [Bacteroidales bacterium]